MIRINLIEKEKQGAYLLKQVKRITSLFSIQAFALILTIVIAGFSGKLYLKLEGKTALLKSEKAANERNLKKLDDKQKELEQYLALAESLRKKKLALSRLGKGQNLHASLLEELSIHLPEEVWLTRLTSSSGAVTLEGSSFTNDKVGEYISSLKASGEFRGVELSEVKRQSLKERVTIYNFRALLTERGFDGIES